MSKVIDIMKRNMNGIIFKLDFEKAYDQVNWDFLWFIMHRMRFGDLLIKEIKRCISCASGPLPVNGTLSPKFNMERRLKQCYPLSSLLFNLVAEALPRLLNQCESAGWINGIHIQGLLEMMTVL